jgi:hypothetical protein
LSQTAIGRLAFMFWLAKMIFDRQKMRLGF